MTDPWEWTVYLPTWILPWTSKIDYNQSIDIDIEFAKKINWEILKKIKKYQLFSPRFLQSKINILNSIFWIQINVDQLNFWPNESPFSKGDDLKAIYKYELNWHHLYLATQNHTAPAITLSSLTFLLCFY